MVIDFVRSPLAGDEAVFTNYLVILAGNGYKVKD